MLITDYAIIKLCRDETERRWVIMGQVNDLPGGVRPYEIWPIVGIYDQVEDAIRAVPRSRAPGFLSSDERFAYIYMKFLKRAFGETVTAVDDVRVEFNGVRIA